jgi:polyisoprenoid-binding protein YceI
MLKRSLILIASTLVATSGVYAQETTYKVDPTHTFVTFEAKHFGTSTSRGRFDQKDGMVILDMATKKGRAEITIDLASISTGVTAFDNHLKSKDFFNIAEFPKAIFKADDFTFKAEKVTSVSGELTLLGQTKPVTLTATNFNCYTNPKLRAHVCGGDFETTIQRSSFGMNYGLPFIPDTIKLIIQVEAAKQ